jgi:hypothetical protein
VSSAGPPRLRPSAIAQAYGVAADEDNKFARVIEGMDAAARLEGMRGDA